MPGLAHRQWLCDGHAKAGCEREGFAQGARASAPGSAADEGKQYSKFLKENFLKIKDVQDAEEISAGMKKLLKKFQPELDAVGGVLPKFVKYGYEE